MIFKLKPKKSKPRVGHIRIIKSFCIFPRIIEGHCIWLENVYIQQEFVSKRRFTRGSRLRTVEMWENVKFSKEMIRLNIYDRDRLYYRTKK